MTKNSDGDNESEIIDTVWDHSDIMETMIMVV